MRRPQCTHCRKYGHRAAQCPQRDMVKCRGCGELGHTSGLCKKRAVWVCKKCSGRGHGSWECAEAQTKSHLRCYLCNEAGHHSIECSNTEKWKCKICNGGGHKPAGCPRGRKYKGQICYACGEKGHLVSQCTEATCFICGLVGHIASRCPAKKKRGPQPTCAICGFSGHEPWQCLPEWDGASSKPSAKSRHPKPASEAEQPKSDRAPDNGGSTTAAAGHDDDCKCMLCDLVKKRKRAEPKPSSAKATPRPADDGRTANHANGAHEATCKCFICLLKKRGRGKAEPEPNSEHARTGGDVPSPSGSSAGTPVGNTSSRGPACVCTVCNRTRTHDAKQAPVEHSQDHAAMQLWNRGTTALASGQIEQAIRLFGECIARDPNAAAFFTSRGDAHMATKDYSAASGDFQRACELLKGVPAPAKAASMLVKVARCRLCLGSHGSAMLAVQEALGIDASADAARALKRRLTRMQEEEAAYQRARAGGRWRAARTAWETCVRLYEEEGCVAPVDVRCWGVDLAVAECAWEKAKSAVDQLFAEAPQAIVVMLAKINLLFLSGELQHALEQAKAALKSDPDNLSFKSARTRIKDVLKAQGDARVCSCNHDAALESWHRALELVPDRPEDGGGGLLRARLLIDKAQAELELQRHAEALKSVDASLKLDAAHWRTYLIRGRIHAGLELFDAAVDDFKTCLQRALTKGSGASASDLESLRREVEETESLAAEAKNTVKDYYKILGLPRTCTLSEIRKAFRTESRKHHPDKGGIEEKFKLVNEAYSTLSDQDAKRAYDAQLDEQALGSTYEYDWGEDTYQNGGDFGWD